LDFDELRFGNKHLAPAFLHHVFRQNLRSQLNECAIMAMLTGPEAAVELRQFAVFAYRRE
jgi:hypothetical protein